MTRRAGARSCFRLLSGGLVLLLPGCAFFGNEYDPCFDDGNCSAAVGGQRGGDGDLSTGGGDGSGGREGVGGVETGGSGGVETGGSGGVETGGSGGVETGGSGGDATGGSGGDATGGTGGGATVYRIHFNELRAGSYVELLGLGSVATDLSTLFVGDSVNDADCPLAAAGSLAPDQYLEVTSSSSCAGSGLCVADCNLEFGGGDTVYLLSDDQSTLRVLDSLDYPGAGSPGAPNLGESWGAIPDGSEEFQATATTPGEPNE